RRLVKNMFSTALCIDQPPLRMDDDVVLERVKNYTDQNFESGKILAFRESQLCASCHVAFDEAAAVFRASAISSGLSGWDLNADGGGSGSASTFVFYEHSDPERLAPAPHLTHPHNNNTWYKTKPTGQLHFRNFRGDYVNVNLPANASGLAPQNRGIQELGEAVTSTDQFYACFTKRMFYFFTGINVSLEDHGDSRLEPR